MIYSYIHKQLEVNSYKHTSTSTFTSSQTMKRTFINNTYKYNQNHFHIFTNNENNTQVHSYKYTQVHSNKYNQKYIHMFTINENNIHKQYIQTQSKLFSYIHKQRKQHFK